MDQEALDAVEALTRLGGIGGTAAVVALSSRKRVRVALERRRIVQISHGRLALPTAERGLDAVGLVGGFASHLTAAAHHGWKIKFPPEFPQVIVPRGRRIPDHADLLVEIFQRELPAGHRRGWATSPLRTVVDCASDLPFDVALCVADSALRAGGVSPDELVEAARR